MAWHNPFRREDENTRHAWGYTFQWTPEHLTAEQMYPLKYSYDVLGEDALNVLDELSPPDSKTLPRNQGQAPSDGPKRDLYALLRDHASEDPTLTTLWEEVNTIPDWVDWEQIARGQDVFYRYGGVALTALAYQSLLGGMGANRVVEVLGRTGGFSAKVARRRMYETTQHILQVTQSLESIKPGGAGHASSVRVRLLHAAVRRRIMRLAAERPEYYSVEEYGVPINDLDSIATIGTFSATLIWLGFPRQGIWLREQEIIDYLALWRLVAHYLGTPTSFFATPAKAKQIMESILLTEIQPSETSKILANNIILSLQGQAPAYASRDFLNANTRWLNGHDLSDALGIGRPSLYYTALVAGQCIFFMALRKIFYAVLVENKTYGLGSETDFEFQYIPNFHTTTVMGELEDAGLGRPRGVERRNLRTLVLSSAVVAVASWAGVRMSYALLGRLWR
ncbi:tat pathway signal sequence [Phlyctema vagabunda]|uniref:Tat pathway signal sequence n=1 Tax=Phlyctema vagabunda TaxID=108571 RepID=A0ABR4PF29_9HELO